MPANETAEIISSNRGPTPEERAEYVMLRLEKFIRDGRTESAGVSFRKWQVMAKAEIILAIKDVEIHRHIEERSSRRMLFILSASLITIGFWGTVMNLQNVNYLIGGLIIGVSGIIGLFVGGNAALSKWSERTQASKRLSALRRAGSLNRRIKKLERELEVEAQELEDFLSKTIEMRS